MLESVGALNVATILTGFVAILFRPVRKWLKGSPRCWATDKAVLDFLNGAALVPFACLAYSAAKPELIRDLFANQTTMAAAGVVGMIFVLGEVLSAGRDD